MSLLSVFRSNCNAKSASKAIESPSPPQDTISAINLMDVSNKLAHVRQKHQVRYCAHALCHCRLQKHQVRKPELETA
jgi:hypothetical protein